LLSKLVAAAPPFAHGLWGPSDFLPSGLARARPAVRKSAERQAVGSGLAASGNATAASYTAVAWPWLAERCGKKPLGAVQGDYPRQTPRGGRGRALRRCGCRGTCGTSSRQGPSGACCGASRGITSRQGSPPGSIPLVEQPWKRPERPGKA